MNTKQVQQVLAPPAPHMVGDGFRVHNFFPGNYIDKKRMSPFFLLDYNSKIDFPPRKEPRGVGVHPHRGFETVTIAYHGSVAHHDSAGNSGVINEGDVQWMTAASGILHKEYHDTEYSQKGGLFQMAQLWVNLPAQYKMSKPKYQAISKNDIPNFALDNNSGTVEIIAGKYRSKKGAAFTFTPIEMYNVRMNKGGATVFEFPAHYNTGILVVEGKVSVNDSSEAPADHFVLFKNEGEAIKIVAEENSVLLVLSGEPINEPIVAYGPFLMNTYDEIQQAYSDFNRGKFGYLDE